MDVWVKSCVSLKILKRINDGEGTWSDDYRSSAQWRSKGGRASGWGGGNYSAWQQLPLLSSSSYAVQISVGGHNSLSHRYTRLID